MLHIAGALLARSATRRVANPMCITLPFESCDIVIGTTYLAQSSPQICLNTYSKTCQIRAVISSRLYFLQLDHIIKLTIRQI